MPVSCEYRVVKYRSLRWADQTSRGVLPSVVYLRAIVKPRQQGGPGPVGTDTPLKK